MNRKTKGNMLLLMLILMALLGGCGGTESTSSPSASSTVPTAATAGSEQPVPTSTNAQSSDIPDTQLFVLYLSPTGGYQLEIPEGWARTISGSDVSFVSNLNAVQVTRSTASTAPTSSSVRGNEANALQQSGRAVRDVQVKDVHLSNGTAVLMTYTANSDPNTVTGKPPGTSKPLRPKHMPSSSRT